MLIAPLIGLVVAVSGVVVVANSTHSSAATTAIDMGSSSTYGVLASSAITAANPSTISGTAGGDIGVGGGTAHTGTITKSGAEVLGGISLTALTDANTAFTASRPATAHPTVELGGTTITPGAYSNGTFGITGTLTLDGQGDPNAVFIFDASSTLITAASSQVLLTNSAQACNVFWRVGSSATLGTSSTMVGHVIASASITANASTHVNGQLIALTAAVTLDGTTIVNDSCTAPTPTATPTATATPTVTPTATATASSTPAPREPRTTPTPVPTTPAPVIEHGTVHIIKVVVNNYGGKSIARDFNIVVRSGGKAIDMSPVPGTGGVGWVLSLAPGIYDLSEAPVPGYRGVWSGPITAGGRIVVKSMEDITVTRTNYDKRVITSAPTPATATPTPTATGTVSGGTLPKTSTPWGNWLIGGGLLIFIGAIGYETRKHLLSKKK